MYGTIAEADAYFGSGFARWGTLTADQKTAALIGGSGIVDALYGHRFPGQKAGGFEQENQWPRINAKTTSDERIPEDLIPNAVKRATYEIVRLEVTRPNSVFPGVVVAQQIKRQKVDVIEKEFFKNQSNNPLDSLPFLPLIEGILLDLLNDRFGDFPIFWVR